MFRKKGFTLIELLIAVSIFSVIALCLYSTFAGGIRLWRRQETGFRSHHTVRLAMETMAKDLKNSIVYSQPAKEASEGDSAQPDLSFAGQSKKMSFVAIVSNEIAQVTYQVDGAEGGTWVLKRAVALQKEGFSEQGRKEEVLVEGLDNAWFEYAYGGKEAASITWKETWSVADKIPRGVRMSAEFKGGGRTEQEILRKAVFIATGVLEKSEQ